MRTLTSRQMAEAERRADEAGVSYRQLMENAGAAAVRLIQRRGLPTAKETLIFVGSGNNGGDGYVAARLLAKAGAQVRLVLVEGEPRTEISRCNRQRAQQLHIPELKPEALPAPSLFEGLIVDAIYGTGFHGTLRENARQAARWINAAPAAVFALDLPSGVGADSGESDPDAVRADVTIAFDSFKPAHQMTCAAPFCGESVQVDIGIPEGCHPDEKAAPFEKQERRTR